MKCQLYHPNQRIHNFAVKSMKLNELVHPVLENPHFSFSRQFTKEILYWVILTSLRTYTNIVDLSPLLSLYALTNQKDKIVVWVICFLVYHFRMVQDFLFIPPFITSNLSSVPRYCRLIVVPYHRNCCHVQLLLYELHFSSLCHIFKMLYN